MESGTLESNMLRAEALSFNQSSKLVMRETVGLVKTGQGVVPSKWPHLPFPWTAEMKHNSKMTQFLPAELRFSILFGSESVSTLTVVDDMVQL